jgi:glycosyltransferase involved in cell wall biosynthesis
MKIVQPIGTLAGTAISRIAITLAEEFARQGHESILVVWNRDKIEFEIDPRVKIIRCALMGLSRRHPGTKLLRLLIKTVVGPQLFLVFMAPLISRQLQKKVLDRIEHDIVVLHAHSVFGFRRISSPFVVVVHSLKSRQLLGGKAAWKKGWLRRFYRNVYSGKHLITVSDGIGTDLRTEFGVVPASQRTIYNPLNIEAIRAKAAAAEVSYENYVIAVGRNTPAKRFDRLLRVYAAAQIPQKLLILGRADENKQLRELAHSLLLEGKVEFLGFQANPYPYIASAKCLLLTSDFEGFGMVIVEALALGTPVIATDCPCGPREIMAGEMDDCLIPVEDEELFAARLVQMMHSPVEVRESSVSRFELAHVGSRYIEVLEALTDS